MAAKKLKIHPLDDRIVVEPVEAEERTSGGIVLPDSAQEKPQRGHVVAVGTWPPPGEWAACRPA